MKQLIKNGMFITATLLLLAAKPALGEEGNSGDLYRANEWSVDAFGSASLSRYTIDHVSRARVQQNTRLGIGAGVNYFFTQRLGLGAEASSEDTHGSFIDSASANMTLRLPLGESGFAPYVFGGGGRNFGNVKTWFAQAGVGVEYRFTPHLGVFTDFRGVLPDVTQYYGAARLGVRFAF